jgi:hypothetical protein
LSPDLDTSTVVPELAALHVLEFFVWWIQCQHFYADDEGLRMFAADAVTALGGWRAARRLLRAMETR